MGINILIKITDSFCSFLEINNFFSQGTMIQQSKFSKTKTHLTIK